MFIQKILWLLFALISRILNLIFILFLELEYLITNNPALILDGWLESNDHQTFIHNWILTEHKQGDQYVLNRLESEQTLFLAEFKLNKKKVINNCLFV